MGVDDFLLHQLLPFLPLTEPKQTKISNFEVETPFYLKMYLNPSSLLTLLPLAFTVFASPSPSPNPTDYPDSSFKNEPTVHLRNGSYYGRHLQSFNQDLFLGIPFAEPPIGKGRFANPVPFNRKWRGRVGVGEYASVSLYLF